MNVAIAILGLALLVLVHEAGHFFVARAVGMSPRKFYIGFPPALVKTTRNGIEYGIGAIPLGGYVKIPGIHRPAASDLDLHFGRALGEVPELVTPLERVKRPLLVFDIERTRELLPELEQATSEAELSPAARKSADRALVDLHDGLSADAYWRAKTWKRIAVIAAGPGTNVLLAVILFAVLYSFGGGKVTARVDQVLPGHPAAQVGLRHGDTIVSIDGAAVKPTEISRRISGSKGRPLSLVVERNGSRVALGPVRPKKDQGAYRLGFVLRGTGLSPPAATWASLQLTWAVTTGTVSALGNVFHKKDRQGFQSAVGVVQTSSTAASQGVQSFLFVLGLISMSLALLNLLPMLPLDGGHIAFSILEGVRGRPVGREIYERVSVVGIALVLMLFFIGLSNDVGRLGGG